MNAPRLIPFCGLLFLTTAAIGVNATAQQPRRTFPVGIYRQDGSCTKLVQGPIDRTAECSSFLGVVSFEDDRPQFIFARSDGGAWFFVSSGPATYSEDNSVATYPISQIFDQDTKAMYPLEGECVIRIEDHTESVDCTTWREKERRQVAWQGLFKGDGVWVYKPR